MSIIWLASYPKSGNTWLRVFLTNYCHEDNQPASINALIGKPIATDRNEFDELLGLESSDLNLAEIERYRPLVCRLLATAYVPPLFIKVHDAYTTNGDGYALFPAEVTDGVLYIIRNPLDVAASYAHHENKPLDRIIERMNCEEAYLFDPSSILFTQLPQKLFSWSSHVCSWVDNAQMKTHVVRYEDMVEQPLATFTEVIRFTGLVLNSASVQRAIDFSRFQLLQAQEDVHGFAEKQPTAHSFFRQGAVGSWREQLTQSQVRRLVNAHGQVMERFGYLPEAEAFLHR